MSNRRVDLAHGWQVHIQHCADDAGLAVILNTFEHPTTGYDAYRKELGISRVCCGKKPNTPMGGVGGYRPRRAARCRGTRRGRVADRLPGLWAPTGWGRFGIEAIRLGLKDHGYVEGQNIRIEYRWAEDRYDRLPELAAELVRLNPDVIITYGTPSTLALKRATSAIPIVMSIIGNPVENGAVASLARPGGNITGSSFFSDPVTLLRSSHRQALGYPEGREPGLGARGLSVELPQYRDTWYPASYGLHGAIAQHPGSKP